MTEPIKENKVFTLFNFILFIIVVIGCLLIFIFLGNK